MFEPATSNNEPKQLGGAPAKWRVVMAWFCRAVAVFMVLGVVSMIYRIVEVKFGLRNFVAPDAHILSAFSSLFVVSGALIAMWQASGEWLRGSILLAILLTMAGLILVYISDPVYGDWLLLRFWMKVTNYK